MVSQRHYQRLQNLLKETNGEIVIGGKTKDDGNYIEPTVVVNVKMDDALLRDELFGPILPIVEVKDINEAIKIVRADEKPLASYCFGKFLIFQITEKSVHHTFTVNPICIDYLAIVTSLLMTDVEDG